MQNWFRLLRELFFQTKGQKARVTILRIFIMSTNYTNNSLNQEFCKFLAEPIFVIICKLIFLSIILICSLVGNALIITVVSLRQELRKTINFFIVNMAVSDLIFPLVSIPFSLAGIATNSLQWPIRGLPGLISCKLSQFLKPASLTVSVCAKSSLDCTGSICGGRVATESESYFVKISCICNRVHLGCGSVNQLNRFVHH